MSTNNSKSLLPGVIAALAASLCCITPAIALLGGISGIASSFSWIEPARPYLIGITIVIFAFAWYQQLKNKPVTVDHCCEIKPVSFWRSKKLLLLMTLFSAALVGFPYYSSLLYTKPVRISAVAAQQDNLKVFQMSVKGMGCADCTKHIDGTLVSVPGVVQAVTSFEKAQTTITFDPKKTNPDYLKNKIGQIGYRVTAIKE